jgi:hypothetical protein
MNAPVTPRSQVPSRAQLSKYSVNRPGWEAIRQSLYDYQAYAATGHTFLSFFSLPVGQAGKTQSDTNMTLAGQLPKNQEFLIQSVEIVIFPTTPTVAAQMPSALGATAVQALVNDVYIIGRSGNLQMVIGSKPYLAEAPLGRFPPKTRLDIDAALSDATTAAANLAVRTGMAVWAGRPYVLDPAPLLLPENQNFSIQLNWPEGAQPIANPARIGVVLDGILYRRSQ